MPVEEDINLDNPDGLTQDDLDILKRQADQLADLAVDADKNADKIKKAREAMEGLNFKQIDLIREGPTGDLEGLVNLGLNIGTEQMQIMMADMLSKMKEADEQRKANAEAIKKEERERKELEMKLEKQRLAEEARIRGALPDLNSKLMKGFSFQRNPLAFARGGAMNFLKTAGPWGFVAAYAVEMVQNVANQVLDEIKSMYEDGGVLDTRKDTLNALREVSNLKHIIDVEQGKVYFTDDTAEFLRQGIPQRGNTRDKINGHKQYLQEFDR